MRAAGLITLEGGEGAGKTTVAATVERWLRARGRHVLVTREPGGTPIGEQIREILLNPAHRELTSLTELLLMFAARAQHLDQVVRPALHAGVWVVCDRFTDASMAYQGHGRGLGEAAVHTLAELVHADVQPALTLLLDIPVATGLARARGRGEPDRFERDRTEFLQAVRDGYLALAAREPRRIAIIDASQAQADVEAEIETLLSERLE